jgi:hypothetical protein
LSRLPANIAHCASLQPRAFGAGLILATPLQMPRPGHRTP